MTKATAWIVIPVVISAHFSQRNEGTDESQYLGAKPPLLRTTAAIRSTRPRPVGPTRCLPWDCFTWYVTYEQLSSID
jgi:hypothetical protein